MSAYVVRRLLLFVPALVGASMLIFVLMRLVPGDIAEILVYQTGSETSGVQQKQIQRIRQELGLTKPVMVQYLSWMGGAVRGDFGKSYTQRRPVWDILRERFPRSMELAILTLAIALIWAIPLGVISAVHQNRPLDYVARIASLSGLSIPLFVSGAPGMGTALVQAVSQRDYPTVQAMVFVMAVVFLVVNLLVDLLYVWLDPRIHYA